MNPTEPAAVRATDGLPPWPKGLGEAQSAEPTPPLGWRLHLAVPCDELYDWLDDWLGARVRRRAHDLLLGVPPQVLPIMLLGHALFPAQAERTGGAANDRLLVAYLIPLVPEDRGCELVLMGMRVIAPVPVGGLRLLLWFSGRPQARFFSDLLHDAGLAHLGITTGHQAPVPEWAGRQHAPAPDGHAPLALAVADLPAPRHDGVPRHAAIFLPSRAADLHRWQVTWRTVRARHEGGQSPGQLRAWLQAHHPDLVADVVTVRKIARAGAAGLLDG